MKIIKSNETINFETAVAIGMFDGVHRGHQKLINETINVASANNLQPTVFTFFNHPVKEKMRNFINVIDEKIYLLEKYGISVAYITELDDDFMGMEGKTFFEKYLVTFLKSKAVIVGEDFKFGFNRACDVESLRRLAGGSEIKIISVPLLSIDGEIVKSSSVHRCIVDGLIEKANKMLGYNFFVSGDVVKGKGLGRHIGFPTANIRYLNGYKVLPKNGIYITLSEIDGVLNKSVTNVGYNPTFDKDNKIKIETHFLDMSKDLYGKFVRLHFISRIRDEEKFASIQQLRQAITRDVETAEKFFLNANH
jgi:riboflavin kinase/FMN adenylyltransferase